MEKKEDCGQRDDDGTSTWQAALKEQAAKHGDPDKLRQDILKILAEMLPAPVESLRRAIDEHGDGTKARALLSEVFGESVRVKVIEAFLKHPAAWFNLVDLSKVAGIGKASAKRVVDELLESGLGIIEEREPEQGQQSFTGRLVRLSSSPLASELSFFYSKLRGLL